MSRIPEGWGFDEFGDMVPGGKFDMYESNEDLEASMKQENDLQKAFKLEDHVEYQGIKIAIENKEGSIRRWTDINGSTGETKMVGLSYGYVKGTLGADQDEIDVFVGPDPRAEDVYIIDQQNPHNGTYDEQKCFLGFGSQKAAEMAYRLHYNNPDTFIISIQSMDVDAFKRWVKHTKPNKGEMGKSLPKDDLSKSSKDHLKLVILVPDKE